MPDQAQVLAIANLIDERGRSFVSNKLGNSAMLQRRILAAALSTIAIVCSGLAVLTFGTATATTAATSSTLTYSYDSLGRIITDAASSGNSGAYTYDNAGNRTAASLN